MSRARALRTNSERARERLIETMSRLRIFLYPYGMHQHCFVAERLNTTLFCRNTLIYFLLRINGFCAVSRRKWHALRCEPTPHFVQLCLAPHTNSQPSTSLTCLAPLPTVQFKLVAYLDDCSYWISILIIYIYIIVPKTDCELM